jgi:FkbM family methyltransferase
MFLKKFLIEVLSVLGIYTLSSATTKYGIPNITIRKEIKKNLKYFFFFKSYFFLGNELKKLKKKIQNNYIHHIKIDDFSFKLTFLNYGLDKGIVERIQGIREPTTVSIIRSLCRKGNKVLELGSCYGYFTSIMSNCVGNKGKVLAIEGLPNNFKILKKNIHLNNLKNVSSHQFFVSNLKKENEMIYFNKDSNSPYEAIDNFLSKKKNNSNNRNLIAVKIIKLSNFLKKINFTPDNIFMDIEGFELDVLEDLIHNFNFKEKFPTIVFEIHNSFYKGKRNLEYIKSLLNKIYHYQEDNGNLICLPKIY